MNTPLAEQGPERREKITKDIWAGRAAAGQSLHSAAGEEKAKNNPQLFPLREREREERLHDRMLRGGELFPLHYRHLPSPAPGCPCLSLFSPLQKLEQAAVLSMWVLHVV